MLRDEWQSSRRGREEGNRKKMGGNFQDGTILRARLDDRLGLPRALRAVSSSHRAPALSPRMLTA